MLEDDQVNSGPSSRRFKMKFKACKRGHKRRTWGDTFGCGRLITIKAGRNRWRLAHGRFVKASKMFKVPFESSTSILASGGIYRLA